MTLRKIIKTRGSFPSEDAAFKLIYLALQKVSKKWQFIQSWREALNRSRPKDGAPVASPHCRILHLGTG
jgi:transposase-like protein